jgi:hypothetical protein
LRTQADGSPFRSAPRTLTPRSNRVEYPKVSSGPPREDAEAGCHRSSVYFPLGVSSFFVASGEGGFPGTDEAPGVGFVSSVGLAGGPIGAEPDPVGGVVTVGLPGEGAVGAVVVWAKAVPVILTGSTMAVSLRILFLR